MYTTAFTLAFIITLLACLGVIFMKWIIAQVGISFFAVVLVVMSLIFILIAGDKKYGE